MPGADDDRAAAPALVARAAPSPVARRRRARRGDARRRAGVLGPPDQPSALGEFSAAVRAINGEPDFELRGPRDGFDEALYARVAGHRRVALASPVVEIETRRLRRRGPPRAARVVGIDALVAGPLAPGAAAAAATAGPSARGARSRRGLPQRRSAAARASARHDAALQASAGAPRSRGDRRQRRARARRRRSR